VQHNYSDFFPTKLLVPMIDRTRKVCILLHKLVRVFLRQSNVAIVSSKRGYRDEKGGETAEHLDFIKRTLQ